MKYSHIDAISSLQLIIKMQQSTTNCYQRWQIGCSCFWGCLGSYVPCCCCCNPYNRVEQYEVGLLKTFGKFTDVMMPGLHYVGPFYQTLEKCNVQTKIIDLKEQRVYTRDNIGLNIDTVCFYRIVDPQKAMFKVKDVVVSISQITYVTLRTICGEHTLQELLEKRERINEEIQKFVSKTASEWGVVIEKVLVKDTILSAELQRNLSVVSTTKKLSESKIISAQSDLESAKLYREAADILDSKVAMQIRFLQTLTQVKHFNSKKVMILSLDPEQIIEDKK